MFFENLYGKHQTGCQHRYVNTLIPPIMLSEGLFILVCLYIKPNYNLKILIKYTL